MEKVFHVELKRRKSSIKINDEGVLKINDPSKKNDRRESLLHFILPVRAIDTEKGKRFSRTNEQS